MSVQACTASADSTSSASGCSRPPRSTPTAAKPA
jgi:hypothetical protein